MSRTLNVPFAEGTNAFRFPVEKSTIIVNKDGRSYQTDEFCAIINKDNGKVLHTAGADYTLLPNSEIIDAMMREFDSLGILQNVMIAQPLTNSYCHLKNSEWYGKNMVFQCFVEQPEFKVGDMQLGFYVHNSYNESLTFGIASSLYRLVCSNGAITSVAGNMYKRKHTSGMVKETVLSAIGRNIDNIQIIKNVFNRTFSDNVPTESMINDVSRMFNTKSYKQHLLGTRYSKDISEELNKTCGVLIDDNDFFSMAYSKCIKNNGIGAYDLYNAATDFVSHKMPYVQRYNAFIKVSEAFGL